MMRATPSDEALLTAELRELAVLRRGTIERLFAADELRSVELCLRYMEVDLESIARNSGFPLDLLEKIRDRARLS